MTKHNPKKQLLQSLFGRYSVKRYELPEYIFKMLRRRLYRNSSKFGGHKYSSTIVHSQFQYYISIPVSFQYQDEFIFLFRPKRNRKTPKDKFLVGYTSETAHFYYPPNGRELDEYAILKIPHTLQFVICLKAAPVKK